MENFDQVTSTTREGNLNFAQEVKSFYKGDFKTLLLAVFTNPFDGLRDIFQRPAEKSFIHSSILFATVFLLYFLGAYLLAGNFREFLTFSALLSFGVIPVLTMLSITGLSWLIKASTGGRPNFKNELLTGAMCGIPLALVILFSLLARVFGDGTDVMSLFQNPLGAGMVMSLIMLYLLLMMVNIFQQSLKSASVKDLLAWYLSPLCILTSFYVAFQIFGEML
jgi:hypothetical protein